MPVVTLRDLKGGKRRGGGSKRRRRAAPPRYSVKRPEGHQLTPGADGKCLDERIMQTWGACRHCEKFGHFASNCPAKKTAAAEGVSVCADGGNSLCVGALVRARYRATSDARYKKWYAGAIKNVHVSGHVDIGYDDGDQEERVAPKYVMLRAVVASDTEGVRAARLARFDPSDAAPAAPPAAAECCICTDAPPTHVFIDPDRADQGCRHLACCSQCCATYTQEFAPSEGGWPCPICQTNFTEARHVSEVQEHLDRLGLSIFRPYAEANV